MVLLLIARANLFRATTEQSRTEDGFIFARQDPWARRYQESGLLNVRLLERYGKKSLWARDRA